MKHYLLTWYGITDLRAALALEATDGPILGALKTGRFTDAVIAAYTNPSKDQAVFTNEYRAKWEKWRTEPQEARLTVPKEKAQQLVDAASNTGSGHALFSNWLKDALNKHGISCNIQIIPHELKCLNDARGIYNAATSALKIALDDAGEKTLTTFISPGTPVMSYTWALIARSNPQLNISVISSSDPRRPPETIELPKDLLMPIISSPQTVKPSAFDIIIHLLGRERMPVYFGMIHFPAGEHIFITTHEYANAVNVLAQLLPPGSKSGTELIQDPFKPSDTRRAIEKHAAKCPETAKIAVNLTGGTKLMFAGALSACWEHRLEPFYFEVNNHNIIFIRDGTTVPFKGEKSVSNFFTVNGFNIITRGRWEDKPCRNARFAVTQKLWEARKTLVELYGTTDFQKYNPPWGRKPNPPFDWRWGNSHAAFDTQMTSTLVLDGEEITVQNCDDFGQYLGGGWFEEYVFSLLRQLEQKGLIYDLRIGMEVNYTEKLPGRRPIGEFDCAFTDGKRLWLVECKAGMVKQEHIQKLENNLKTYGGIAAKGILASVSPINPAHEKRISSSTSIFAVQSENLGSEDFLKVISSVTTQG